MATWTKRITAAVVLAIALTTTAAAQLTSDERLCSDAVNKSARDVGKQQQKANRKCVKDGNGDINTCVDTESDQAAGKRADLIALFNSGDLCQTLPAFGVNPDPVAIADGIEDGSKRIIQDIFGDALNDIPADDSCSDKMAQRAGKKYDDILKAFRKCAKHIDTLNTIADLEACVGTATAGATKTQAKLDADVADLCTPVPPPATADGACGHTTTAAEFSACIGARVNCDACVAINRAIGGAADCDMADDGLANGSCLASHECSLGATSKLSVFTSAFNQVLVPSGVIDVNCGTPEADGTATCTCNVKSFAPINIGGSFWACLSPPTSSCAPLHRDCNGGDALNLSTTGHRNVGSCTSNAQCATKCATTCGGAANVLDSECEGFCSEGAQMACTTDVQCGQAVQGACNGPDGDALGHVCDCTCLGTVASPAARPGAISCLLGFNLTIESIPGDHLPCDGGTPGDGDLLITAGDYCAPTTTEFASGQILNANNNGATIPSPAFNKSGAVLTCEALDNGTTAGLRFSSGETFFGTPLGDLFVGLESVCQ